VYKERDNHREMNEDLTEHSQVGDVTIIKEDILKLSSTITMSNVAGTRFQEDYSIKKPLWKRLNHKGPFHDNRRLLKHRAKNCECFVCYREIHKLPPAETNEEYVSVMQSKIKEREIKRASRIAKKEIKTGKQSTMDFFYKYMKRPVTNNK